MSASLWFDAFRPADGTLPRDALVSQALRLRWQVLEYARLGDGRLAGQHFRALQGVATQLQCRADRTPDDSTLADLCIREAELAVLTCRVQP